MRWLSERQVAFVLLLAVVLRGGVLVSQHNRLTADPDGYTALACNLIEYGVFGHKETPSAYRPPFYPLLLAACIRGPWAAETAIAVLHLVLGTATVWLTLHLGRRWQLGGFAGLAGVLVACDPILLNQSALVMTETLAALMAVLSLTSISAVIAADGSSWRPVAAPRSRWPRFAGPRFWQRSCSRRPRSVGGCQPGASAVARWRFFSSPPGCEFPSCQMRSVLVLLELEFWPPGVGKSVKRAFIAPQRHWPPRATMPLDS